MRHHHTARPQVSHDIQRLIDRVCAVAGSGDLVSAPQSDGAQLRAILQRRDNAKLFEWLMITFSYQGVSDRLASGYIERNGRLTWSDVKAGIDEPDLCPRLQSYWHFSGCGYGKAAATCAEPAFHPACSLPRPNLRNGRLNQLGYSLFLFIRDIAGGDLIGWIDRQIRSGFSETPDPVAIGRSAIIEPLKNIYGVSDKVLMMTFADLLMSAPAKYQHWFEVGAAMVAVDTLVHAFLVRTGILAELGKNHPYGPACYGQNGCASVLLRLADGIDARKFNAGFPAHFPRRTTRDLGVLRAVWARHL